MLRIAIVLSALQMESMADQLLIKEQQQHVTKDSRQSD